MNVSFSVAMMLQAVNNMGPGIQSAQKMINRLGQNIKDVARQSSNLNPVQGWENRINKVAEAAKRIGKELKESGKQIAQQGEKMQNSGMRNTAEGIGLMAPVLHIADKAGELQMKKTSMQMSGISGQGVGQLITQADAYTQRTLFSKTEIADMFLSMRQSGMKEDNILRASEPLVMLAELENIRRGTDGRATAKVLAQMAERGGVLRDPNIERWNEFLEIVNQVTTVTTAGMHELHESSKYLEPVASIAGWNEKDMMMSQGIAARFGLEGSIAGTDLKDMIARLNPLKWFKEGRPAQQLDAMQRLGWLTDVESHKTKAGRIAYDKVGGSTMLNKDGTTVNMLEMFGQFAKSYANYKDLPNGRAKFAADMFKVLGEQGEKTALLVAQNYETVLQMLEDAGKVKPIHQQIDQYSMEYMQSQKAFKSSIENLEIDAGNLLLPNLTAAAKELRAWVNMAREFTTTHPGLVGGVLKFMLAMGVLKIGIGLVQLIFGTLMTTFGGAMTVFGWLSTGIGTLGIKLLGLRNGFQYFRGLGGGVFESLWKGAQFAWPWLQRIVSIGSRIGSAMGGGIGTAIMWLVKLGGGISRFVMQWLIHAARIGAGWLIAMGPVGWIILGVTALIAAGVWAWNTNFMSFRDKCISVWNIVSDWGKRTWTNITGFVQAAIDRISHFIDRVKEALGLSQKMTFYGPVKGVELDTGDISFVGGNRSNTNTITQHNHISLKTPEEAASFAQSAVPEKYQLSLNP
ncbi:MAG: phage tail tape measure protein family [Sporomusa sp.]|jgi:TP901 family phage tail tape measure protein|nr:phage tail tape measure protein family [Sporomusa sp.]